MPMHPDLRRIVRKFVLDLIPGALASVIAAVFFAQQFGQPQARVEVVSGAVADQEIVQLIRDEHALVTEFLKIEHEREIARQPLSLKEMKALEAMAAPARRGVDVAREVKAVPLPPEKPNVEIAALESSSANAPEPKPAGLFARIAETAVDWTEKAIDLTGVRLIPSLIGELPGRADLAGMPARASGALTMTNASH